jgi:predicted nucleotidyltransferase
MNDLNLQEKVKNSIRDFIERLKALYQGELISVILYGSGASGEFADKGSNLNFLVVLKNTQLDTLKAASGLIRKFPRFHPLFFTEHYIATSNDIFPIEFLDIKENYRLLHGKDVMRDINIDTRNLRFQCEQELKARLLGLRNAYLAFHKNKAAMQEVLSKAITSVLHISRNVLRLKGRTPAYKKEDIIKELEQEFKINAPVWGKALAVKNKTVKLNGRESEALFIDLFNEVEKIADIVDRL